MNQIGRDLLEKLLVAALLGAIGWTYHFVTDTAHRLDVLEWRVNERLGPPTWEQKGH